MTTVKWSKQRVIEAIRDRHQRGLKMTSMCREDGALAKAAQQYFATWGKAVRAAGLSLRLRQTWSRERVLTAIQGRQLQGLSLANVHQRDRLLHAAAVRHYGTWRAAMQAAGLLCKRRTRTKQSVLEALKARQQQRLPMATTWRDDQPLYDSARWYFGSWANALAAIGLQPKPPWTPARVIAELQDFHRRGMSLKTGSKHIAMYGRAKRFFGTWRKALEAAGLAPKSPGAWTAEDVIAAIHKRQQQGLPLVGVWQTDRVLSAAAKRHFGTWYQALAAAGLPRQCTFWNKEKVIQRIQANYREGGRSLGVWKRDRGLSGAANRYFGSWPNALEAAGVPHKRRRQWSKEVVLQELRAWHRGNGYVPPPALGYAARKLFGSIQQAWEAAGFEPAYRKWTKRRVIEAIQDGHVRGLSVAFVGFRDRSLGAAARNYFGTWADAVAAAGLPRDLAVRKKNSWTKQKVLQTIQAWHEAGRQMRRVWKENRGLHIQAAKFYGTWHAALRAAGLEPTRKSWTKHRVVEEIRAWHQRGVATSTISGRDGRLTTAAVRLFGRWHKALAAAGLNAPTRPAKRRRMTKVPCTSGRPTVGSAALRQKEGLVKKGTTACHAKTSFAASSNGNHRNVG